MLWLHLIRCRTTPSNHKIENVSHQIPTPNRYLGCESRRCSSMNSERLIDNIIIIPYTNSTLKSIHCSRARTTSSLSPTITLLDEICSIENTQRFTPAKYGSRSGNANMYASSEIVDSAFRALIRRLRLKRRAPHQRFNPFYLDIYVQLGRIMSDISSYRHFQKLCSRIKYPLNTHTPPLLINYKTANLVGPAGFEPATNRL